ncbi:hypothetical protein [Acinetobacter bereziniae]|uniref:hypothetical protein n=1 Tax=Acinetobacter bereziniae TaxID=106648 RepID=UPI003AF652D0
MDKPSNATKEIITAPQNSPPKPLSGTYAESVRMTPERILNAVIKNKKRQGGSIEH